MTKFITIINDVEFEIDGQWNGDKDTGEFNVESIRTEAGFLSDDEIVDFIGNNDDRVRDDAIDRIETDNKTMFDSFNETVFKI